MSPMPERMTNHWWWRPGVRPGRRLYVWHILFQDQPAVQEMVSACHANLERIAGIDLVPSRWLHMTTHIVGFADEFDIDDVKTLTTAATKRLQRLDPIPVSFGRRLFHSEAVMLGIRPTTALHPIRAAVRDATADTLSPEHVPPDDEDWTPHVTVAYSNSDGPAAPVIEAMPALEPQQVTAREIHLVAQERVGHLYRWEEIATIPIGEPLR